MEFNTQESIIVNTEITKVEKIIKELIIEINGVILSEKSKYFLWTYKYGIQTIECQTFLIKKKNKTEITTIAESDEISQKGERFIIKKLYTKLVLNNQIQSTKPYIQERIPFEAKPKQQEKNNKFKPHYLLYFLLGTLFIMFLAYQVNNNEDNTTEQEIKNSNLDDSDNNNPNVNNSYQSKISAEDKIKLRQFKNKVQVLFDQLMIFKNEKEFQEVGFAVCCKYNEWMTDVEALVDTPEAELFNNRDYYLVNELGQLGRDYIHLEGRESEYTNWNKKRLIEALKEK